MLRRSVLLSVLLRCDAFLPPSASPNAPCAEPYIVERAAGSRPTPARDFAPLMVQGAALLLCGGKDAAVAAIYDGTRYADCWRAPIASAGDISWTRVATSAWSARAAFAWAFRPSTGSLYIFGGEQKWTSPNRAILRDVYSTTAAAAGAAWTLEAAMQLPARRCLHAAVVDTAATEDVYIFAGMTNAGTGGGSYANTILRWRWSAPGWTVLSTYAGAEGDLLASTRSAPFAFPFQSTSGASFRFGVYGGEACCWPKDSNLWVSAAGGTAPFTSRFFGWPLGTSLEALPVFYAPTTTNILAFGQIGATPLKCTADGGATWLDGLDRSADYGLPPTSSLDAGSAVVWNSSGSYVMFIGSAGGRVGDYYRALPARLRAEPSASRSWASTPSPAASMSWAPTLSSAASAAASSLASPTASAAASLLASITASASVFHTRTVSMSASATGSPSAMCPAGTVTVSTAGGAILCQQCPGGHYCPAGATSWAQLNCGRGNYCPAGSSGPTPCPYQVPPTGGWGALRAQGPAFLVDTATCANHCFWNFTGGALGSSKC